MSFNKKFFTTAGIVASSPSGTTSTDNFDIVTYTGNGGTQSISSLDFQPDLVWVKAREASASHALFDSIRGVNDILSSESTSSESDLSPYGLTSFDTNGFTVSDISSGANAVNGSAGGTYSGSGAGYVAWCWKAGGTAVTDSSTGTLTANISANTAAGFSIVNYTGNQTSGATFPHGLDSAAEMVIIKNKSASTYWFVYHKDLSTNYNVYLNTADSQQADNQMFGADANVVTVGSSISVNSSTTDSMIAYCFHSVDGYQKVGSYTSPLSVGTKITTGFRPRFLLIKADRANNSWHLWDSLRDTTNPRDKVLRPNTSDSELDGSVYNIDFVDDGFEIENTYESINHTSATTYIYLAIA